MYICYADTGCKPPLSPSKNSYLYTITNEEIFKNLQIDLLINPIITNCPGIQNLFRHICFNNEDGSKKIVIDILLLFWRNQSSHQNITTYKSLCYILFTLNDGLDEKRISLFLESDHGIYTFIKNNSINRPDLVIYTMCGLFELSSQIQLFENKLKSSINNWNFINNYYLNRTNDSPSLKYQCIL